MTEDELRAEFERQHKDRDLSRHRMRGTYIKAQIAALWNQHKRTAEWLIPIKTKQTERTEKRFYSAVVRVCPDRDIECGNRIDLWCLDCPKHREVT